MKQCVFGVRDDFKKLVRIYSCNITFVLFLNEGDIFLRTNRPITILLFVASII